MVCQPECLVRVCSQLEFFGHSLQPGPGLPGLQPSNFRSSKLGLQASADSEQVALSSRPGPGSHRPASSSICVPPSPQGPAAAGPGPPPTVAARRVPVIETVAVLRYVGHVTDPNSIRKGDSGCLETSRPGFKTGRRVRARAAALGALRSTRQGCAGRRGMRRRGAGVRRRQRRRCGRAVTSHLYGNSCLVMYSIRWCRAAQCDGPADAQNRASCATANLNEISKRTQDAAN